MAVQVPKGTEGQPLPHPVAPGVERKDIPQVDRQVNSLLVPFSWDSFSSLQAEQELL